MTIAATVEHPSVTKVMSLLLKPVRGWLEVDNSLQIINTARRSFDYVYYFFFVFVTSASLLIDLLKFI